MPEELHPDYSLCPSCPEIKRKIDRIDLALLGEDGTGLNGGIVKAITDLQKKSKVSASWANVAKIIAIASFPRRLLFLHRNLNENPANMAININTYFRSV